jgi:hypothetical protein
MDDVFILHLKLKSFFYFLKSVVFVRNHQKLPDSTTAAMIMCKKREVKEIERERERERE